MEPAGEPPPLLLGRGGVLIADFCLNTGLDRDTVEDLVRTGRLDGALSTAREPIHSGLIFDDALPSRDELVAMGHHVRDDYDPHALRYGGIECQTHGWAPAVLLTRYDADRQREVADRTMCSECSLAGVLPDSGNSSPIRGKRRRSTSGHDGDSNGVGSDGDEESR